jgi:serine phosphatase RsbU (regulator of sigma subunit)/pSer/pThr/pTyr-binding forkhead associated (FHA) protein
MEYLEITDTQGRRRRVELKRNRLLVGREPTCDVYLPHPNVSRRHAQIQRSPEGSWILQDLNSLNHVYVGDHPVQQIVLEGGTEVRIAEYRLTLLEASTIIEPGKALVDKGEPWTSLGPAWIDQLHAFQRELLRSEQTRQVLEKLAHEFSRIAQPQVVAVGTAHAPGARDRYHWDVILYPEGENSPPRLEEASARIQNEESEVQCWAGQLSDGDTPGPVPPLCLLFPMKGRSGIIGHVYVFRPRLAPLPPEVQRYLGLLVTHAGLVWDNLQLVELRGAQKQYEQELRQARQIQIGLFPPTFDVDPRLNAFAVNLPSVRVSGDYYDLVKTGPNTVAFVIADAMGHGMPAAILMAAVRAGLRMGLLLNESWAKVFKGLDEIIVQARPESVFVTGLVGQIDLARRELQIVSAGHLAPSILVGGRPVSLPPVCQTRPWGLDFDSPWEVGRVPLGEGDWSILCYTDGVIENERPEDSLNAERAAAYHRANAHLSAEDVCQGIVGEAASTYAANGTLADDQTVLVLRSAGAMHRRPPTLQMPPAP